MSQRDRDLRRVAELRSARQRAVAEAAGGSLRSLLSMGAGDDRSQTYVVKLLDVTPGLGKVAGRRLLASLGIDELTRVAELSEAQRAALLGAATSAESAESGSR